MVNARLRESGMPSRLLHLSPRAGRDRNRRIAEVSGEGESPRTESELDTGILSNPRQRIRGDAAPCPSPGILASLDADLSPQTGRGDRDSRLLPIGLSNSQTSAFPRRRSHPGFAKIRVPRKQRAQGVPGAQPHPQSSWAERKNAHKSSGRAEIARHSLRNGFTAAPRSPWCPGSLATIPPGF